MPITEKGYDGIQTAYGWRVSNPRRVGLGFSRNRTLLESGVFQGAWKPPWTRVSTGARKPLSVLPCQAGHGVWGARRLTNRRDMLQACVTPSEEALLLRLFREGCNGRENSPPLVEAFPSLAKVGIGGQKATRRAIFCTTMHTLSSAQSVGFDLLNELFLCFFCTCFRV